MTEYEDAIAQAIVSRPVSPVGERLEAVPVDVSRSEFDRLAAVASERVHADCLSMLDEVRLANLVDLVWAYRDTSDSIVECGVAKGGAIALMTYLSGANQTVWGFDSFEGFPDLTEQDAGDGERWVGVPASGEEGEDAVHHTFASLGVSKDRLRLVKGWFDRTIEPRLESVGPIAILRLDSDWYESTMLTVSAFYDQVVSGGVVIVDDYFKFQGCRSAIDEYRAMHGIDAELTVTNPKNEVCWIKP